jgi:adenylate kinase family enzyme
LTGTSSLKKAMNDLRLMKAVIIGNSGSGKTWLATSMAECLGADAIHLDNIFWRPQSFQERRSAAEVSSLLASARSSPSWIVEGVFGELAKFFLPEAEVLVWLDLAWDVCEKRLRDRSAQANAHMGRYQNQKEVEALLLWAGSYDHRNDMSSYAGHGAMFASFTRTKHRLVSQIAVELFLSQYKRPLSSAP